MERALEEQAAVFLRAKSPYLRERVEDLRNIKQMLVRKRSGSTLELSMPRGEVPDGACLLIDGDAGLVTVDPDEEALARAEERRREQEALEALLRQLPLEETVTRDGVRLHVSVNIGGAQDLEGLDLSPLDGVGLYRTEFLFVGRTTAPSVEEQAAAYQKVFDALEGRELIVRALDIGGTRRCPALTCPRRRIPFWAAGGFGCAFSMRF